jgi:hypothetical protein
MVKKRVALRTLILEVVRDPFVEWERDHGGADECPSDQCVVDSEQWRGGRRVRVRRARNLR